MTHTLLSTIAPSSQLYSPVLLNTINQITSSPSFPLTPQTLTWPLQTRLAQIQYPTTRLHLAAQNSILGVSGCITGGVGIIWAGWAGLLVGGVNVETYVGVGILSALVGVRWAIARWENEKNSWWGDWKRIGDGLGRDLKVHTSFSNGKLFIY